MPRPLKKAGPRVSIRIPKPMIKEVDRIVWEHRDLYNTRQVFVETAIREEIKRIRLMERRKKSEKNRGSG